MDDRPNKNIKNITLMSRGFTSETLKKAQETKSQNIIQDRKVELEKENALLRKALNDCKIKYSKIKEELKDFQNSNNILFNLSKKYPLLYRHIQSLNLVNDSDHSTNGNRFDPQLYPIYVLLSMSGKYYQTLLHNLFGFPCTKTCRNIKSKYKQQHGIDETIFNGSNESIVKLLNLFWESDDTRCIISVDAAAVNAKLTVHKDGRIEGLMNSVLKKSWLI